MLLTFLSSFPEGINLTLTINEVADNVGNATDNLTTNFSVYTASEYDELITEIFADIEPQNGLPLGEYVELYNNTDVDIDLSGFVMKDATTESDAFSTYILTAGTYVVLVDADVADLFTAYPNVLGITSFPSLNNDGDDLQLYSPEAIKIHTAYYTLDWYDSAVKEDGAGVWR
ncbi:MAG: lamin tail domain-containing protein [Bacteroidetes bacterium]|nr:lamin tail domain-containing protein [Bacteroidota bacterium]